VDPPEPELELEAAADAPTALMIRAPPLALVAPAALLRVMHALLPLYAVLARLAQFAQWRRRD